MKFIFLVAGFYLMFFISCQTQNSIHRLNFEELANTEFGSEMSSQHRLIASQTEFEQIYRKVYAHQMPTPTIPAIDFSKNKVLFIHFGTFSHGGNSFRTDSITYYDKILKVYLQTSSPGLGQPTISVITHPFLMLKIENLTETPEKIEILKNKTK
ncbi:MAG: protease complex subunit PrcB family protein [Flavobacteriaceae bacterium]|nr:protease complex subunit PrcB family protein [Flavobacteriaceae bacterium]